MPRTEECPKNAGFATIESEQRVKAYPNKGSSEPNLAEFDQRIAIMPVSIDQAPRGATMKWNAARRATEPRWNRRTRLEPPQYHGSGTADAR